MPTASSSSEVSRLESAGKVIVVLGGGIGGVVAARELRKRLAPQHRVILVDRESHHLFPPSLLWLITGRRAPGQISRPLARLAGKNIEVVRGEIEQIDPETRRVRVAETAGSGGDTREIDADYLIISLGAELDEEAIPGLAEAGHSIYSLAGAESLRDSLTTLKSGRILILTATPSYKCPAAPYEAAMLVNDEFRKRGMSDAIDVDIYAAEPGPLGVAGPDVSDGVRNMVLQAGIGYFPDHQVVAVDADQQKVSFANGSTADFDILAYIPPHRAPDVVRAAGMLEDTGWVAVDRETLQTGFPGVFAIGDITGIPLLLGKPLPKAGVFAERQAAVVAHNIAAEIAGDSDFKAFNGHGECFIEVGGHRAGFGKGNFYAEPTPQISLHKVGLRWHLGKLLFERNWLRRF